MIIIFKITNNFFASLIIIKNCQQFIKIWPFIDTIKTNLVGDYNLPNVLCAVAVAKHFNVPEEKIKTAIEDNMVLGATFVQIAPAYMRTSIEEWLIEKYADKLAWNIKGKRK